MLKTKIVALCTIGSILLGSTVLGGSVSSLQSNNQPKAIVQDAMLASEITEESKDGLACELIAEPGTQEEPIFCGLAPKPEKDIVTITNEVDMYNDILDYFIGLDEALNSDMKYIAVNFKKSISDENKEKVIGNLKKYNVDIIEGDMEYLKSKGLSDEYGNLYGILLSISDIKVESKNRIIINGSKYRSGLGSVSAQVILNYNDGIWDIEVSTPQLAS
jgi:hypothetical protein